MKLGVPVKWTGDAQRELPGHHPRARPRAACGDGGSNDGKLLGVRATVYAGMGAYLSTAAPGIPTILHGLLYVGPYTMDSVYCESIGVMTNGTPTDAYRGAGRPEATFLLERMVDNVANALDMDPGRAEAQESDPAF